MDGLIAGVDLCDAYTQVNCAGEEKVWTIPTVLCRSREEDLWYVGEDAYAHNLKGDGIIVDKLVKLALRGGRRRWPACAMRPRICCGNS